MVRANISPSVFCQGAIEQLFTRSGQAAQSLFENRAKLEAASRRGMGDSIYKRVYSSGQAGKIEAAKPKISIQFSQLDKIRRDASETRDSLLTEEEKTESEESGTKPGESETEPENDHCELSSDLLNDVQLQIMRMLLNGESPRSFISENHLMPSVVADGINEALFDEIGDTVLECDGDDLSLIEDYIENINELLGG